jgi:hypothetical protein
MQLLGTFGIYFKIGFNCLKFLLIKNLYFTWIKLDAFGVGVPTWLSLFSFKILQANSYFINLYKPTNLACLSACRTFGL